MKEQGIEEVFKKAFDNFEADVDPNVWTNVQSHINSTPSAPANGSNGSIAGKLGVKGFIAILAAATGVSVGAYFMLTDSESKKEVTPTVQTEQPADAAKEVPQQESSLTDEAGAANAGAAVQGDKVAPIERAGERLEKKQVAASPGSKSEAMQPSTGSAPANKNNTANATSPVATTTQTKSHSPKTALPPVRAEEEEGEQGESAQPAETAYENNFAPMKNYLEVLPNIFTPNGDGRNDNFELKTKNVQSLTVTIFDESGKLVYQWKGLDGKWDGNLSDGRPAPAGTYFYSVFAETTDGKTSMGKSTLTLTRK